MAAVRKAEKRDRRHARIRAKVFGTPERPRLSVFKSNRYVYAQLIDDTTGTTLASANSLAEKSKGTLKERAHAAGKKIAEDAKAKNVSQVVFDRGGFIYTGIIAAVAEGAREGGLQF